MFESNIEMLIDAIEEYDSMAPFIILLYLPSDNDEIDDFYFAALASLRKPNSDEMNELYRVTKEELGNMIYASDYLILPKDDAIEYLEDMLD
jgi:hypothetical protein